MKKVSRILAAFLTVVIIMSCASAALADVSAYIKVKNFELVNIRTEPFTHEKNVAFQLPNGAPITIIAWANPTWSKIKVAGHSGEYYVQDKFTAENNPTSNAWNYRYGTTTLKKGSSGKYVKNLQRDLKKLKYYSGSIDGDFGTDTEKAVKAFQKAMKLTVDGKVGKDTREKLWKKRFGYIK